MSRAYDAANAAIEAYPKDREKAIALFLTICDCSASDIEYEYNLTPEEYIFGKEEETDTL